jgi:hypothetical protein
MGRINDMGTTIVDSLLDILVEEVSRLLLPVRAPRQKRSSVCT